MIRRLIARFLPRRKRRGSRASTVPATIRSAANSFPAARDVTRRLHEAGFKAFIVGGAVRDLLLGIKPKDFDIATDARRRT
jgi:hypothetical protein